jgi:hypothetical protein
MQGNLEQIGAPKNYRLSAARDRNRLSSPSQEQIQQKSVPRSGNDPRLSRPDLIAFVGHKARERFRGEAVTVSAPNLVAMRGTRPHLAQNMACAVANGYRE